MKSENRRSWRSESSVGCIALTLLALTGETASAADAQPNFVIIFADDLGYGAACFGKWHLGHLPQYLPNRHGFDEYLGLPYSNDMDRVPGLGPQGRAAFDDPKLEYWNVPLIRGTEIIERPADQSTLTRRY